MTRKNLWIWGTGGHARVVADAVRSSDEFTIVGYINNVYEEQSFDGRPVVSDLRDAAVQDANGPAFFILAFGDIAGRRRAIMQSHESSLRPATVVHCAASVLSGARLGDGCFVAAHAVVGVDVVVGNHAIINTAASADHDCRIAENVHLAPGVRLAGSVHVAQDTLVGIGACVCPRVSVGAECIVGAGSVVLHDVPDRTAVFGIPAEPSHTAAH